MVTDTDIALIGGVLVAGAVVGYLLTRWKALNKKAGAERETEKKLEAAKTRSVELILEAEEKAVSILGNAQKEERERKQELRKMEERLLSKEDAVESQKKELEREKKRQKEEGDRLKIVESDAKATQERAEKELERVSGLTKEEAKKNLYKEIEEKERREMADFMARFEREKRDAVEAKSAEVIVIAMQRYARNSVADVTTSVVHIPNEEIKGKIIGREGRNIKAFERLTGVEVVVDETPESILLSSFDPMRRELAKIALEKLVKDGRIQPARIEEAVEEARVELEKQVIKAGEEAAYEVGVVDIPKEILKVLGRLNYRTSYGQNVLNHSIEMALIAGMLASELKLNVDVTKKGALLHDIGKAIDHEVEGTHVEIGIKLLRKYGMDERVIQAMQSHHEEYPYAIPEAYVVTTADVISGARPGARRDTLEKYLKRLEEIEKAVHSFEGVQQAYAVSAGREVRVFVTPEKIDDFGALQLAKDIAEKIQKDVRYPGEIRVVVVREVRAVEYAR